MPHLLIHTIEIAGGLQSAVFVDLVPRLATSMCAGVP
jgi:hypothetical protein